MLRRQIQEAAQAIAGRVKRRRQYRKYNADNPLPLRIAFRMYSSFGTPEVFQQPLELGYEVAMKSFSDGNAGFKKRFEAVPAGKWTEVERNRYAGTATVGKCAVWC